MKDSTKQKILAIEAEQKRGPRPTYTLEQAQAADLAREKAKLKRLSGKRRKGLASRGLPWATPLQRVMALSLSRGRSWWQGWHKLKLPKMERSKP